MPRRDDQAIALLDGLATPATGGTPGAGPLVVASHVVGDVAAVSFIVPRERDSHALFCIYERYEGTWSMEEDHDDPWCVSFDRPKAAPDEPLLDWPLWWQRSRSDGGCRYVIPGQAVSGVATVHARASDGSVAVAPVVPETGFFVVLGHAHGPSPAPIRLTARTGSRNEVSTIEPLPVPDELPDGPMIERLD